MAIVEGTVFVDLQFGLDSIGGSGESDDSAGGTSTSVAGLERLLRLVSGPATLDVIR